MRTRRVAVVATVAICVGAGGWLLHGHDAAHSAAPPPDMAIPVTSGVALAQDVPIYAQGVGTRECRVLGYFLAARDVRS